MSKLLLLVLLLLLLLPLLLQYTIVIAVAAAVAAAVLILLLSVYVRPYGAESDMQKTTCFDGALDIITQTRQKSKLQAHLHETTNPPSIRRH